MFALSSIDYLIINNITPPTINADAFTASNITTICVPDAALTDYQTAGYGSYCTNLKGISECPSHATKQLWETAGKPVALIEEYM